MRFYGEINSWELYDLSKDPHEMKNVYGTRGYENIVRSLKQDLKKLILLYKDEEALKLLD
jgi:hypothetical protein